MLSVSEIFLNICLLILPTVSYIVKAQGPVLESISEVITMTDIKITENLTQLRAEKGVTQDDVAKALGVSNKTVSKWENGTSAPDLSTLVALAEYYNVSTDALLGLSRDVKSIPVAISNACKGPERNELILKISEIIYGIFSFAVGSPDSGIGNKNTDSSPIPPKPDVAPRSAISIDEFFGFVVNSDNVNLSVMQWQNQADFSWLLEPEKQDRITKLLHFLGNRDVLQIMYFLHNASYSKHFTTDYAAKHTGLEASRVEEILETCYELGLCTKSTAHLKDGETFVYEAFGDGLLLSIISIAYEKMCGSNGYGYYYGCSGRLIGGAKQ